MRQCERRIQAVASCYKISFDGAFDRPTMARIREIVAGETAYRCLAIGREGASSSITSFKCASSGSAASCLGVRFDHSRWRTSRRPCGDRHPHRDRFIAIVAELRSSAQRGPVTAASVAR